MSEQSTAEASAVDSHAHPAGHGTAAVAETNFTRDDIAQFDADDTEAGSALGKLLAITFLYTIIAMSITAWWTFARS